MATALLFTGYSEELLIGRWLPATDMITIRGHLILFWASQCNFPVSRWRIFRQGLSQKSLAAGILSNNAESRLQCSRKQHIHAMHGSFSMRGLTFQTISQYERAIGSWNKMVHLCEFKNPLIAACDHALRGQQVPSTSNLASPADKASILMP